MSFWFGVWAGNSTWVSGVVTTSWYFGFWKSFSINFWNFRIGVTCASWNLWFEFSWSSLHWINQFLDFLRTTFSSFRWTFCTHLFRTATFLFIWTFYRNFLWTTHQSFLRTQLFLKLRRFNLFAFFLWTFFFCFEFWAWLFRKAFLNYFIWILYLWYKLSIWSSLIFWR